MLCFFADKIPFTFLMSLYLIGKSSFLCFYALYWPIYKTVDKSDVSTALPQQDKWSYQLFVYLFNDSTFFF